MADPEGKPEPCPDDAEKPSAEDEPSSGTQAAWALAMLLAVFSLMLLFLVWGSVVELIRWAWNRP